MTSTNDAFWSIPELALRWSVHPSSIRKWIAAGLLPAVTIGKRARRVRVKVALAFEDRHQLTRKSRKERAFARLGLEKSTIQPT